MTRLSKKATISASDARRLPWKQPFLPQCCSVFCVCPTPFLADCIYNFRIDLYSVEKSLTLESEINTLLNNNGIAWQKTEQYLDDQSCWETEFTFDVLGDYVPPEPDEGGDGNGP